MSFRPKTKSKSKYQNGLPQFYSYKDKAVSNNYSQHEYIRLIKNFYHKYRILSKVCIAVFAIYIVFGWMFNSSMGYYSSSSSPSKSQTPAQLWSDRKLQVKTAFLDSWNDYVKHGWGDDVYSPVSQKGHNMGEKPLGWIIVDSLDTLMLMDCKDELEDARSWVDKELDYNIDVDVNVFETTIRMLGGLLSAHYLSDDDDTIYLEKAVQLGNKLVTAFDDKTGLPVMELNLQSEKPGKNGYPAKGVSTSEISTLQLEFKLLSNLTGEAYFWNAAEKVNQILDSNQYSNPEYDGLAPIYVNQNTGKFNGDLIRLGARGDSYYEYLLKQYLQTDEKFYFEMYQKAYQGIKKHLLRHSTPNNLVFLGELPNGIGNPVDSKMDHLVCFIGGLFALGATEGFTESEARSKPWWDALRENQLKMGTELGKTCYHMYHDTPGTGLSPEAVVFNERINSETSSKPVGAINSLNGDFYIPSDQKHNLQRPETVETLYYLFKITGDIKYREWGWEIFQNFVQFTKVTDNKGKSVRYTSLKDCTVNPPVLADNMESFWLAETLKYLYLLFDDETGNSLGFMKNGKKNKWDLRNMVFNTEAHPLPKFDKGSFGKEFKHGESPIIKEIESSNNEKIESKTNNIKIGEAVANEKVAKKLEAVIDEPKENEKVDDVSIDKTGNLQIEKKKLPKVHEFPDSIGDLDTQLEEKQKLEAIRESKLDESINNEFNKVSQEETNEFIDAENDNLNVAENLEATGKVPVPKHEIAKSLEDKFGDALKEPDTLEKHVKIEEIDLADLDTKPDMDSIEISKKIAEKMKAEGEKPGMKQTVAKPLDEQAEILIEELDASDSGDLKNLKVDLTDELTLDGEVHQIGISEDQIADLTSDTKIVKNKNLLNEEPVPNQDKAKSLNEQIAEVNKEIESEFNSENLIDDLHL